MTTFKIIVYSSFSKPSRNFLGIDVHYLNSNNFDRWDAFKKFPDSWLCFLDADCTIDKILIDEVSAKIQNLSTSTILCGRYKTETSEPMLSHAYNTLCNTWLEAGLLVGESRLLGGCFVINSSNKLRAIEFEKFPKWGAEDYRMAQQLSKHNFDFELVENLFTSHKSKNELVWFFKRAWIHGGNRPSNVKINSLYWLKMILQQNIHSNAYIFMHFSTVFISKTMFKVIHSLESLMALSGLFSKQHASTERVRF